jgi:ribosomal protein L11 methylase PrmA
MEEANNILDKKWVGGLFHLYNTDDTWNQWLNEFEPTYSWDPPMAEKFIKVIGNNQQYIKNKNVIDLACNLGYFTLGCSNIGAKTVLGAEVRQKYIDVFNRVKPQWPQNNVDVIYANVEKNNELAKLLAGIDTILYTGHLYHTTNHLSILTEFTKSSATCIIIDSIVPNPADEFVDRIEDVANPLNGFIDEYTDKIPVRAPSLDQVNNMLITMGWTIVKNDVMTKFKPQRFVVTATRN